MQKHPAFLRSSVPRRTPPLPPRKNCPPFPKPIHLPRRKGRPRAKNLLERPAKPLARGRASGWSNDRVNPDELAKGDILAGDETGARVLIVEDDPVSVLLLRKLFEQEGI